MGCLGSESTNVKENEKKAKETIEVVNESQNNKIPKKVENIHNNHSRNSNIDENNGDEGTKIKLNNNKQKEDNKNNKIDNKQKEKNINEKNKSENKNKESNNQEKNKDVMPLKKEEKEDNNDNKNEIIGNKIVKFKESIIAENIFEEKDNNEKKAKEVDKLSEKSDEAIDINKLQATKKDY